MPLLRNLKIHNVARHDERYEHHHLADMGYALSFGRHDLDLDVLQ